jgi:hypothetical protein
VANRPSGLRTNVRKQKKDTLTPEQHVYFRQEHEDSHPVVAFEVVGPYSLHLTFDDGTERTIDFEPALRQVFTGPLYEPMLDPAYFVQVTIDRNGILTWPNGADFNPAYVYNWPKHVQDTEI